MQQPHTALDFRRIRTVGEVLNSTFVFLRQNTEKLGKSLLFYLAPVAALMAIFSTLTQSSLANPDTLLGFDVGLLFSIFFTMMVAFSVAVTIVHGYLMLYQDRGPDGFDIGDVRRLLTAKFFRIFGTMLFLLFLAFVGYIVSLVPMALLAGMAVAFAGLGTAAVFVVSFLMVLGYLGFLSFFIVTLSLMLPMRMREPIGLWAATTRCFRLTRNNWWATFSVFFVATLLNFMLSLVLNIPYFILTLGGDLHAADAGAGTLYSGLLIALNVVATVGGMFFYSVPLTAMALQYFNLVERKEMKGLLRRIEAINAGPEDAASTRASAASSPASRASMSATYAPTPDLGRAS